MLYTLRFFPSKCSLFHNANMFGSCIIHILHTGVLKLKKNNSGAKGLIVRYRSLRRADPSSRGVLPIVCVTECDKLQ